MAAYEPAWPGCSPYCYGAVEYAGVVLPAQHLIPYFYHMGVQKPRTPEVSSTEDNRKFLLERSIFDLVDGSKYLSLSDQKLMNWYLCLASEDKRIIKQEYGGFQQFLLRHPALELSQKYAYVKRYSPSFVPAPTVTYNRPTSVSQFTSSGAAECGSEMPGAHLDSENNVWETLNPLGCSNSGAGPQKDPTALSSSTTQTTNYKPFPASSHQNEQRSLWPTSSLGAAVWKDSAALSSFSLDVDLERHSRERRPESDGTTIEKDLSPEYCSFDSIQMDDTEYSSVLDPVEENRTEAGLQDHGGSGNERTEGEDEASLSFGDQSDNFHSLMEDKAVLFCLTGKDVKALNDGAHSASVRPDIGQCFTKSAETGSSPKPCVATCDVKVGSDVAPCTSADTQTEGPKTADKDVNTEVYMSDLDYLVEEFTKLNMVRGKLRGQKEEKKSTKLRPECDCLQRAQRAELSLLALQYSMCRQHCWKLHCTSSEGPLTSTTPENPSSNITSVLQKLERDYNRMRDEIRAGVPLDRLQPLSVDPESMATRPRYIPAKIISDVQGPAPSRSSREPQKPKTSDCPNDRSSNGSKPTKTETDGARSAVLLVPRDGDATHNAPKPEETQTAACQELSACEAWYDAEDDLHRAGPAAQTGREPTGVVETKDSSSEEAKSAVLCVSNLPSDVTESDVTLWFEKHRPSEVSISALKNDLRVAIVTVSGPHAAEAAVGALHGRCMRGRALHVEHINSAAGSQRASEDSTQPQTSTTKTQPVTRPLGSSLKNRRVVSISPTAKGTFVPQHWGTMGSFDTLMAELTQRHPAAGRQRIADALMELRMEQGGVLSGMPLRTIREMTSQLLTRPPAATRL